MHAVKFDSDRFGISINGTVTTGTCILLFESEKEAVNAAFDILWQSGIVELSPRGCWNLEGHGPCTTKEDVIDAYQSSLSLFEYLHVFPAFDCRGAKPGDANWPTYVRPAS